MRRLAIGIGLAWASAACSGDLPARLPETVARPVLLAQASDAKSTKDHNACADGADSVYVFDDQGRIHLFEPDGPVERRFQLVATPDCGDASGPQSMSLDHEGVAWLLFTSGRLFKMKLPEGECEATPYQHAGSGGVMGMTFTAADSGSKKERLYISDRMGLFEVRLPDLQPVLLSATVPVGELAGGPDGLVFHIDLGTGMLSELDRKTLALRSVHPFGATGGAFTLLRHRRGFFYFSAEPGGASHIYRWSPRVAETIDLGMAPEGIRILGRAQSVCVEWSEGDGLAAEPFGAPKDAPRP